MSKRILVVEHDEATLEALGLAFRRAGLEPVSAPNAQQALARFREATPAAVLIAVDPEGESVTLVAELRRERDGAIIPILFMGEAHTDDVVRSPSDALSVGGDYFFKLPTDLDYLAGRVLGWTGESISTHSGRLVTAPVDSDLVPFAELTDEITELTAPIPIPMPARLPPVLIPHADTEQGSILGADRASRRPGSGPQDPREREALEMVKEGERLRTTGHPDGAIRAYAAAAEVYEDAERIDPALALHKLIVHLDPTRRALAEHAAELARAHGKTKDAIEILKRPAKALEAAERYEEAASVLRILVKLAPGDPALVLKLASLESKLREEARPISAPMAPLRPLSPAPAVEPMPADSGDWDAALARELALSEEALLPSAPPGQLGVISAEDGEALPWAPVEVPSEEEAPALGFPDHTSRGGWEDDVASIEELSPEPLEDLEPIEAPVEGLEPIEALEPIEDLEAIEDFEDEPTPPPEPAPRLSRRPRPRPLAESKTGKASDRPGAGAKARGGAGSTPRGELAGKGIGAQATVPDAPPPRRGSGDRKADSGRPADAPPDQAPGQADGSTPVARPGRGKGAESGRVALPRQDTLPREPFPTVDGPEPGSTGTAAGKSAKGAAGRDEAAGTGTAAGTSAKGAAGRGDGGAEAGNAAGTSAKAAARRDDAGAATGTVAGTSDSGAAGRDEAGAATAARTSAKGAARRDEAGTDTGRGDGGADTGAAGRDDGGAEAGNAAGTSAKAAARRDDAGAATGTAAGTSDSGAAGRDEAGAATAARTSAKGAARRDEAGTDTGAAGRGDGGADTGTSAGTSAKGAAGSNEVGAATGTAAGTNAKGAAARDDASAETGTYAGARDSGATGRDGDGAGRTNDATGTTAASAGTNAPGAARGNESAGASGTTGASGGAAQPHGAATAAEASATAAAGSNQAAGARGASNEAASSTAVGTSASGATGTTEAWGATGAGASATGGAGPSGATGSSAGAPATSVAAGARTTGPSGTSDPAGATAPSAIAQAGPHPPATTAGAGATSAAGTNPPAGATAPSAITQAGPHPPATTAGAGTTGASGTHDLAGATAPSAITQAGPHPPATTAGAGTTGASGTHDLAGATAPSAITQAGPGSPDGTNPAAPGAPPPSGAALVSGEENAPPAPPGSPSGTRAQAEATAAGTANEANAFATGAATQGSQPSSAAQAGTSAPGTAIDANAPAAGATTPGSHHSSAAQAGASAPGTPGSPAPSAAQAEATAAGTANAFATGAPTPGFQASNAAPATAPGTAIDANAPTTGALTPGSQPSSAAQAGASAAALMATGTRAASTPRADAAPENVGATTAGAPASAAAMATTAPSTPGSDDAARAEAADGPERALALDERDPVGGAERPTLASLPLRPLVPDRGQIRTLGDAITLFAQLRAQRSTGLLQAEGLSTYVVVHGEPAALRGELALDTLSVLLEPRLLAATPIPGPDERPVMVGRALVSQGKLRERECFAYLHHHLELGVLALLRHRGPVRFETEGANILRDELVPEPTGTFELLVDLLPWVVPGAELLQSLGGPDARLRAAASPGPLLGRDARFATLLDGQHRLEDAARLAMLSLERAAALGALLVGFGRATVVPSRTARPAGSGRPEPAWMPLGLGPDPQKSQKLPVPEPVHDSLPPAKVPHAPLATLEPKARLKALAELVRTSDYFTILGIDFAASKSAIDQAHHRLRSLVAGADHRDDPEAQKLSAEVLRSLDEARDVLKIPELRTAYLRHLKP